MRNALSFVRFASAAFCCALAALLSPAASAQTIDLGLKLFYSDPMDSASGGTWELIAKSGGGTFGIESLSLRLAGIEPTVDFDAPRALFGSSNGAGFSILGNVAFSGHRNVIFAQEPRPAGENQGIFYGVGTIANGEPGDVGPPLPTLSSQQNIPWAVEPDPPGDLFDEAAWDTAATFASGTFAMGVTPAFFSGTTGQVFTSLGTATSFGNIAEAMITTEVRDNLESIMPEINPDYNGNGVVDAADYVLWRKNFPTASGATMAQGDADGDMDVDTTDYDHWYAQFGNPIPGTASGGLSSGGFAVPEPASGLLWAVMAALWAGTARTRSWAVCRVPTARRRDANQRLAGR